MNNNSGLRKVKNRVVRWFPDRGNISGRIPAVNPGVKFLHENIFWEYFNLRLKGKDAANRAIHAFTLVIAFAGSGSGGSFIPVAFHFFHRALHGRAGHFFTGRVHL